MTKRQREQEKEALIDLSEHLLGRELILRERKCLESIDNIVSLRFLTTRFPQIAAEQDFEVYFVDYVDYCKDTLGYCLAKLNDSDPTTRFSAVEVLRGLATDGTAAIPRLCELLHDDPDEQVRAHCAFALSELSRFAPDTMPAIQEALERAGSDTSAVVLSEAEAALKAIC
jgi:HEAT repeats